MHFNARRNLPIFHIKLLCNSRHKAWPRNHQVHVRISVSTHRGKQLSKWFTSVLNCDDFLNCGYMEELLVIICKNRFLCVSFFKLCFKLCWHVSSGLNTLKPMKLHQMKQYFNCASVWPIINKIECNYASLIISSRPLLYQHKWGVGTVCDCCKQNRKMRRCPLKCFVEFYFGNPRPVLMLMPELTSASAPIMTRKSWCHSYVIDSN